MGEMRHIYPANKTLINIIKRLIFIGFTKIDKDVLNMSFRWLHQTLVV